MNSEVSDFLASHTYSDATRAIYARVLSNLNDQDLNAWSASDLLAYVKKDSWGNSLQCTALYALRKFIRWKYGAAHPALSAKIKRIKPRPQRSMSYEQVLTLLASFDTYTAIGARDQALLAVALDTGFRVSELARIQLADVDLEHRSIQVVIKGGQWGFGVYSPETGAILDRWLSFRKPADGVNALFVSVKKNRRIGRQLTPEGIKTLFKRWGEKAGFKLSPHDARRTFAMLSTRNGAPSRVLQVAGRWSDIKMVERYTAQLEASAIAQYLPMANITPRES
jgi:integrase/recombinase XerD